MLLYQKDTVCVQRRSQKNADSLHNFIEKLSLLHQLFYFQLCPSSSLHRWVSTSFIDALSITNIIYLIGGLEIPLEDKVQYGLHCTGQSGFQQHLSLFLAHGYLFWWWRKIIAKFGAIKMSNGLVLKFTFSLSYFLSRSFRQVLNIIIPVLILLQQVVSAVFHLILET